jgi:RND family efflux transporter MFP subunit
MVNRNIASAAACAALLLGGAAAQELPFPVAEIAYQTVARERVYDAVIEPVTQATVSAQTSGRIIEVNFDVDDFVPKGAVLVRFRDTEQRARVAAEQASLSEAQALAAQAEQEYERALDLHGRDLISKSDMDKATAERKAARARLEAARARLRQAREQLEHTVVKAPYAGIVVERQVEEGEAATIGQPIMTGLSLETLRATANVPQNMIAVVREKRKARVILSGGESLPAGAITISPYADPGSHTFKVRVNLPEGEHGVYPGMFAKVAFLTGEERRLVVPKEAVVYRSEVTGVYVVKEDGSVALRQIRLGRPTENGRFVVLAGLAEGDRVALEPVRAGVYLKSRQAETDT